MSKPVDSQSLKPSTPSAQTSGRSSRLERWLAQTLVQHNWQVQYRLRGNTLHLLCRRTPCPPRHELLRSLIPILQKTNFAKLQSAEAAAIYQIWLYGCETQSRSPQWTAKLYLNQLDRHLQELAAFQDADQDVELVSATLSAGSTARSTAGSTARSIPSSRSLPHPLDQVPHQPLGQPLDQPLDRSALTLSNQALAKRGEEMAIACYLSETLSELGVAVRVSAKVIPYQPPATVQQPEMALPFTTKRLWIACEAAYSPDPALLSEPITQKLRQLEIEGFHDAVIRFQVAGEPRPDWILRVDLTPPSEMLREWARWGDLEAIQRLLNQDIAELQLKIVTATLNATTLHLCCASTLPHVSEPVVKGHKRVKADIALLLEAIAPQGIHAATLYGQISEQEAPAWIEWLDLPATHHPAFAAPTIDLAQQGDWGAIAFSLHRLLNPNLDEYLATGGIRLQLLPKQDLLHVMCEAAHCPDRQQVVPIVMRFLKQLHLADVAGVRVYGRRSGQKKPLWSDGVDLVRRSRLVPEADPEFAATEMDVADLLSHPDQTSLRPDLTPADLYQAWDRWQQQIMQRLQQGLLRTQLFSPATSGSTPPALPGESRSVGQKIALVWGTAGLLLVLQINWLLGSVPDQPSVPASAATGQSPEQSPARRSEQPGQPSQAPAVELRQAQSSETDTVFNASGFTRSIDANPIEPLAVETGKPSKLPYVPRSQSAALLTAEILAEHQDWPSFNSQQLDQKLQLYYRFVETHGAPDVLIVGSSRALRGVDPIALRTALTDLGYADDQVFNLGINGATAQVVDLVMRQLLTSEQLPRLVVWADGARAFNSGTVDVTYNGIVASEAYRQLLAGTLPIPTRTVATDLPPPPTFNRTLQDSYTAIDRQLSQQLAQIAGREDDRDQIKQWFQHRLTAFLPSATAEVSPVLSAQSGDRVSEILQSGQVLPDETGFLSLASQFNPATYYQKYARVLGAYDSDYENFQISGEQEKALQSLARFSQTQNIPIVFVNLPLTEDYLDPVRLEYEQAFRDYMVQFSLQNSGFFFRDLGEQWITQYDYFSDPSHLNRYGAYAVANKLAQDVKIPWLRSTTAVSTQTQRAAIKDES
ncbi:MAG: hypothetical protein MUF72_08370 [Elainella sp. Prado103]|nr:hypothetical protein [Elainella sp. Prado103]